MKNLSFYLFKVNGESKSGEAPEVVASVTKDRIRESLHFVGASYYLTPPRRGEVHDLMFPSRDTLAKFHREL